MLRRSHWLTLVATFLCGGFLAGGVANRPGSALAADPPPIWNVYLPVVMVPWHSYVPIVTNGDGVPGAFTFLGVDGGPIDGGVGTGADPGYLAYFPSLR